MEESLKTKTIHALSWSFVESIGLQGVRFVIGIILARLLFPAQFGLIAMLAIFLSLAQTFLDSGFGAALIQKKNITQKDMSSIFYFNIFVGVITALSLCGLAPLVADFYAQPVLTSLLRVMSLVLVISAFGQVQYTMMVKVIDFKTQTKISLITSLLSGIIGVGMAYRGFGVWSLVAQQLSSSAIMTALLWIFNDWRPAWLFSLNSLKEMFGFGSKLLVSGLLNTIFDNIYLIVIGKIFSTADLGYFTRANNLQQLPSLTLSNMVARVTFPVFSMIQDDRKRLKRGMKKALNTMVLVNFPIMIGLAIVAKPLVLVLLTDKWAPCITYLQLLCIVGLMYPLHVINLNVLQALGRSDLFLRLEVIKKVLIIINITITWRWGIMAMITGQIIITFMSYYLNAWYNNVLLNYSVWEQMKDFSPYLFSSLLMGAIVYSISHLQIASYIILLVSQILVGGVVYLSLCRMIQLEEFMELWHVGWNKLQLFRIGNT